MERGAWSDLGVLHPMLRRINVGRLVDSKYGGVRHIELLKSLCNGTLLAYNQPRIIDRIWGLGKLAWG